MKKENCYFSQLVIPSTFSNAFTYEKQLLFLLDLIKKQQEEIIDLNNRLKNLEENAWQNNIKVVI